MWANRHDSKTLMDVLDAVVVAVPAPYEKEQRHPLLDRGYDAPACRQLALNEGLVTHIPKQATEEQPIPAPGNPERPPYATVGAGRRAQARVVVNGRP